MPWIVLITLFSVITIMTRVFLIKEIAPFIRNFLQQTREKHAIDVLHTFALVVHGIQFGMERVVG